MKTTIFLAAIALCLGARADDADLAAHQYCAATNILLAGQAKGVEREILRDIALHFAQKLTEQQRDEALSTVAYAYNSGAITWDQMVKTGKDCLNLIDD